MALQSADLKDIFVNRTGLLTEDEFGEVEATAKKARRPIEQLLLERSFVSPRYFLELLGDFFSSPVTELKIADIDPLVLNRISEAFARTHLVVPFARDGKTLKVAMADPRDHETVALLERTVGTEVMTYVATERAIRRALVLYRGSIRDQLGRLAEELEKDKEAAREGGTAYEVPSIISFLDAVIDSAVLIEASDIHIEPFENDTIIRFRVDGMLRTVATVPKLFHDPLIARLKVLAQLRIDEHRLPQDGRFGTHVQQQPVDIRLSVVPSYWGEKAVLRILLKEGQLFDLTSLGLLESDLSVIKQHLRRPSGMILVCGPTGSGKTSTLYAFLQEIGVEKIDVVNVSTVEDPIEYTVPRVTQIQIRPDINLTFSAGLRALLRQDPDIIMVGEIRDGETADIAVRAALIGRLILSSLHTNDAIGAVPRLLDMGVEPYLISSTLSLVIAQRLIRKLCTRCRESHVPDPEVLTRLRELYDFDGMVEALRRIGVLAQKGDPLKSVRFFRAKGCAQCDHTGYLGRTAVFEILEVSDTIRAHITARKDAATLNEIARSGGMKTLFADGFAKALLGITDLEEVMRVVG